MNIQEINAYFQLAASGIIAVVFLIFFIVKKYGRRQTYRLSPDQWYKIQQSITDTEYQINKLTTEVEKLTKEIKRYGRS